MAAQTKHPKELAEAGVSAILVDKVAKKLDLPRRDVIGSLIGLVVFYTVLLAVELFLMVKFVRLGPSSLHTGRYHFEQQI